MSTTQEEIQTIIKKDLEDYSKYNINKELLDFFSAKKGLHPDMLLEKTYFFGRRVKDCCDKIIVYFKSATFPLIEFYLNTPGLSVEKLLDYESYAIVEFAISDKDFQFHRWLLLNGLTMPPILVEKGLGGKWSNIKSLCNSSGIEYLNRKVLSHPKSEWQARLNKLASGNCEYDKANVLADSLVPSHEVDLNTVENRFLKFKEKEEAIAKKYSSAGSNSLFWISAKKLSTMLDKERLTELPENLQQALNDARAFSSSSPSSSEEIQTSSSNSMDI